MSWYDKMENDDRQRQLLMLSQEKAHLYLLPSFVS